MNFKPLAIAALAAVLLPAMAQTAFPSKGLRIVVPNAPGGAADLTARTVGEKLSLALGHWVNPLWYLFTAFVGFNLIQSSFTIWPITGPDAPLPMISSIAGSTVTAARCESSPMMPRAGISFGRANGMERMRPFHSRM